MIKIIKAEERYFSDMWNMNSYFLFSFADYFDPNNEHFWNLRVFNDDFLSWKSGFWMHPHKYYEIMTIMLEGTITHKDSLGNDIKVKKNQIQVTDTSTGIYHSEFNEEKEPLSLYQVWFAPDEMSIRPKYFTSTFDDSDFENKLSILWTWLEKHKNQLTSKVSVKRWVFDLWRQIDIEHDKFVFIYLTYWKIELSTWEILNSKDQLRVFWEDKISIKFLEKTDFILILSN